MVLGIASPGDFSPLAYGAFTLCGGAFQLTSARRKFCNSPRGWQTSPDASRNPLRAKAATMAPAEFGLVPFRSPLLGESRLISFPGTTRRFYFVPLGSTFRWMTGFNTLPGFPIRASGPHRLFAPPPGLSQLNTPFVPSGSRGIHPGPLLTCTPTRKENLFSCQDSVEMVGFEPTTSCLQSRRSPAELHPLGPAPDNGPRWT